MGKSQRPSVATRHLTTPMSVEAPRSLLKGNSIVRYGDTISIEGFTASRPTSAIRTTSGDADTGRNQISCFFGSDQDELASPAHFTVLQTTSRNQGSELPSATMIPQWLW